MRDDRFTPFKGIAVPDPPRRADVVVFVMARSRGDRTDSMRGSLRAGGAHGWETVNTLNCEL